MKRFTRFTPAILAAVVLVAACDSAPTALTAVPRAVSASAADHEVEEGLTSMDGVYTTFGCSADGAPLEDVSEGELIALQGQVYHKFTTRRDAMGGFHVTLQVMPVGLAGTSEATGEVFRVTEQQHAAYNQTQAGFNGAWRAEMKLRGTATGRTFWLVWSGTYRLDAEGDLVVERNAFTTVCRPARG